MKKIKTVKIKNEDGSIGEESYFLSTDANIVNMENGYSVEDTIGTINVEQDGNIADQLDRKININDIVDNLNNEASNKPLSARQGKKLNNLLKKKIYYYDTIINMQADAELTVGDVACINGTKNIGDTQKQFYKIVDTTTAEDIYIILNNGLKAKIIKNIEDFHLYQPCLSEEPEEKGCFNLVVFENGFNILVDCGYTGEEEAIQQYLEEKNITHLDIVVVSHFHADHSGCFTMIANNYCDEHTLFFRQMECDWTRLSEINAQQQEQNYNNTLTTLGFINNSRIPEQNEILSLDNGNITLRFLNTDTHFKESYYTANSDSNFNNYKIPGLNNFSLMCELKAFNKTILFCGDIEKQGQINNIQYVDKCDILQIPHHNWNKNGYYKFFEKACPTIAYFNRNIVQRDSYYSYWGKIQRQCLGHIPTYYTFNEHVEIKIGKNGLSIESGFLDESATIAAENHQLVEYIPYYTNIDDDYYDYADWSIQKILSLIREVPYPMNCTLFSTSRYTTLLSEIATITGISSVNWTFSSYNDGFKISRMSNWDNIIYNFNRGFNFNDVNTYASYFFINRNNFSNKSQNTNLNLNVGDPAFTLPHSVRNPSRLLIKVLMSNGNTYTYIANQNLNSTTYVVQDVYPSMSANSTSQYLRCTRVSFTINNNSVTVNECNMWAFNLSNASLGPTLTGTITEISTVVN